MDLFNIYYINFQKVYEVAMMEDNRILSHITNEKSISVEKSNSTKLKASSKAGFPLVNIKADIGVDDYFSEARSSKFVESIEIKTTKSILLHRIIRKCQAFADLKSVNEGDLIKIDNVKLRIMDESSLRQFLFLRREALKGMRVEGIEINNLITSMLSDYSYILIGEIGNETLVIKIPTEAQSEFESKYNVDDLLIGKVSIIGVYKASVSEKFISKNTFNYWAEIGSHLPTAESRIILSNQSPEIPNTYTVNESSSEENLHFVDVFAIVQDVKCKTEEIKEVEKRCFLKRWFSKKKA